MTEVNTAEELVAVAARQGVKINLVEAGIALSYVRGAGFSMSSDEQFNMVLYDAVTGAESSEHYEYTVRELASLCLSMNSEILLDEGCKQEPDEDELLNLRKDELILSGLMEKAAAVIPPVIRQYNIIILEHLKRVVSVEAAS